MRQAKVTRINNISYLFSLIKWGPGHSTCEVFSLRMLSLILLITTIVVFNLFYLSIKSQILGTKCVVNPLSPHDALKHHSTSLKKYLIFSTTKGFIIEISMTLFFQYMAIFFIFSPTSNHLHPLQVENCDSNSRLVVDEDDYGKFRLERVNSFFTMFTDFPPDKTTPKNRLLFEGGPLK